MAHENILTFMHTFREYDYICYAKHFEILLAP